MEIKELLGDLFDQVQAKIDQHNGSIADPKKKVKLVDLSDGEYVSKEKHTNKLEALQTQVADLTAQIKQRDADLADLQTKLKDSADSTAALQTLQAKYDQETKDWQAKLDAQAYEFAVKERAAELNFTSAAAKKAFISEAVQKGFKMDGETLLGYGDWLKEYQAADPGAFASEKSAPDKQAQIVFPQNPGTPAGKKMSLAEMMAKANADPNFKPHFD